MADEISRSEQRRVPRMRLRADRTDKVSRSRKPPCRGGSGYHPVLRTARGNSANQRSGCRQPRTTAVERGCQGASSSVVERWDANGAVPSDARSETTGSTAPPRLLRPNQISKVAGRLAAGHRLVIDAHERGQWSFLPYYYSQTKSGDNLRFVYNTAKNRRRCSQKIIGARPLPVYPPAIPRTQPAAAAHRRSRSEIAPRRPAWGEPR
jgi:hypothetical protein